MIDYAQSFDQFASSLKPSDLALYAGVGVVLWVLFKDKLSPVQKLVVSIIDKIKGLKSSEPIVPITNIQTIKSVITKEDVFFKLVASWKQTRDLALACGCTEAVKVADQMFPYLSPVVCTKEDV